MPKYSSVKTPQEIAQLRENALVHKEVVEAIKVIAKIGTSAVEINELCDQICKKHNVLCWFKGVYWFPGNLCLSVNDCVVHGIPDKSIVFQDGDVVKFDFWVKDKKIGMNTDAAFTLIMGQALDPRHEELSKITQESLYKWLEQAVAGNRVGDIGAAVQKHVESHGFHIVKELTGHALGYNLHERPYVPNYGTVWKWEILKENMVLAIEPITGLTSGKIVEKRLWIYIADGSVGCHFEHTIVVGKWACEIIV